MTIASDAFVVDGRYEVGEVLGRGGMGEVRRARDLRLQRDVAIKFLRSDYAAQPEARRRFESEAHNAGRLTHPNVVLVLDTGEHEGRPYLVMECLPGRTLHDELQQRPVSPARATWIARDVLAALAAAHDMGIVHRDVSLSNILLTDTGRAKLADFGIAKAAEAAAAVTTVGLVVGTPGYLAPERMRGDPATAASDVFALGVVLKRATEGEAIDGGFAELLRRMTAEDPAARPTAVEALSALDGVDEAEEVEPETAAVAVVTEPFERSSPETMTLAAAPAATVVAPAVVRSSEWWRNRSLQMTTVAVAALLGALLLIASSRDTAGSPVTADETNAPTSPTVTTVTTAPPTTIADEAPLQVIIGDGRGDADEQERERPGKGRDKRDD